MLKQKYILLVIILPQLAFANVWQDLWFNTNQQGEHLLEQNKNAQAAITFKDNNWKGVAYYRNKQYQEAYTEFKKDNSAQGLYNQGNALAYMQKYQEAIDAYNKALQLQKDYPDARTNKAILEKLLEQQKQSQNNNLKSDQNKQDQSKSNQSQSDQNKQEQNKANQSQSNQTKQDPDKSSQKQANQSKSDQNKSNQAQEQNPANKNEKQDNASSNLSETQNQDQQQANSEQTNAQLGNSAKTKEQQTDATKQAQMLDKNANPIDKAQTQDAKAYQEKMQQQKYQDQQVKSALSQIPDDPGGLLRNKFLRDYEKQQQEGNNNVNQ